MKKGKIIIISGPGGVGKGTIIKALVSRNDNYKFAISCTTRDKRENEIEGYDYFFIDNDEFFKKIKNDEFVEYNEFLNDVYYGTLKSEIERIINSGNNIILDINIDGKEKVKNIYPEAMSFFFMAPSFEELERRLRGRGKDSEDIIKKRMIIAKEEVKYKDTYDYVILNDNLDIAINEIENIINNS